MSYLASNSFTGHLIPNQIFTGQVYKIPDGYLSVLVSIKLQQEGYLYIYSSNDGITFTPFDQTLINGPFQTNEYVLRGLYFYLKYENFVVEDDIQLLTRITTNMPIGQISNIQTDSTMYAVNPDDVLQRLKVDSSGYLLVAGSGGGGVASDVNVVNQISNYALETTQEDILTELQKVTLNATFNTNSALWTAIDNFPQVQEVSGNITVNTISGFALESSLLKVVNNKGDVEGEIYFSSGAPVWADTTPTPTQNTKSLQGWNYTNTGGPPKSMNFYYYDGTNETDKTLGDVKGQYCVITNNSTKYINKMILITYTVGSLNVWYQSRITHSNYNSKMAPAMQYLLYWGDVNSDIYPNLPRINLSNTTTTGPALSSESILSLSLASDSQSASGDINITCDCLGVVFTGGVSRTYKLMNDENEYTLLTSIKTDLDKNTYNINRLLCDISGQTVKTDISGQTVKTDISGQRVDISDQRVDISGQTVKTDISGQRVDISGQTVKTDISGQTVKTDISGQTVKTDISGQRVDISGQRVDISDQRVDISGQTVKTDISGYALNSTIVNSNSFLGSIDNVLSAGNLITQANIYGFNGSAQEKLTSSGGQLKVYNMDAKISEVISAQTTSNSYLNNIQTDLDKNNYDASGNLKTNVQNSSLDVHCFGSSDGSTWHHIKTNPTGVISTNAILETDANGALTSTVSSGSYNALDVSIKNPSLSVAVSNSVNVASTSSGTWGNSLNNGTINGNQGSTGFNISSYAYIYGIYRDSNISNFDSLRVEYSFDNSTWYYLGDQLYPSIPQGITDYRQGQIYDKRKYSWNYIRIFNPNNYALNNVYLTILGSSI